MAKSRLKQSRKHREQDQLVRSSSRRAAASGAMLSPQVLAERILVIRGQRVLLDADLAQLYEVETRRLNEQVKRNMGRFPGDFMFQLTGDEFENLKSQFATSRWGGRRKLPLAFTEHGAIMAASVLNSDRAVEMSVYVVRAFVQLRAVLLDHKVLAEKLAALERRVSHHDNSLAEVIDAIRALMAQPKPANRPIGFTADLSARDKLAGLGSADTDVADAVAWARNAP